MPRNQTNADIYDLVDKRINSLRLEIKDDIKDVSKQITDLTTVVNNNSIKQAISSTKLGMLITSIALVVSAMTTIAVDKIVGRHP